MDQSIEGFLLHLRSTNQRKEQYFGTKEGVGGGGGGKTSPERVSSFDGRRDKTTRLGTDRGKISASNG